MSGARPCLSPEGRDQGTLKRERPAKDGATPRHREGWSDWQCRDGDASDETSVTPPERRLLLPSPTGREMKTAHATPTDLTFSR